MTGQRGFSALWRWIEKLRLKNPNSLLSLMVNMRNVFQVFVSSDRRYGPIYNLGISNEIVRGLQSHGYRLNGGKPVIILGWSGGGQIAIGAVTFLAPLPGPIYVVSLGGMLSDDFGLDAVDHLWHLFGTGDPLQAMGGVMFAGRWPIMPQSPWNKALGSGKIDMIPLGPYAHNGVGNYFDMATQLPNDALGRSYGQKTLDTIVRILTEEGVFKPKADQVTAEPAVVGGNVYVAQPGRATLAISSELYVRLAALAQDQGLDSVEELLLEWVRIEQEQELTVAKHEETSEEPSEEPSI